MDIIYPEFAFVFFPFQFVFFFPEKNLSLLHFCLSGHNVQVVKLAEHMSIFLSCIYFSIIIPPGKVCALHNTLSFNL